VLGTRIVGTHGQSVRVVEAERHADGETHCGKLGVEFGQRRDRIQLKDFLGYRSGVFRIDIDTAGSKGIEHDCRVAESPAVRGGRLTRARGGLLDDLAQDVRFGKALGPDVQRRRRDGSGTHCQRDGAGQEADRNRRPHEWSPAVVVANSFARLGA
jgi:hypothetical protein